MKTKQVNPMPAFVGTPENPCDFDCIGVCKSEFHPDILTLGRLGFDDESRSYIPRLNKPQVLPDWGWLDNPLLDGFVWEVAQPTHKGINKKILVTASFLKMHISRDSYEIAYASIKGVQKGSQLEDWAIENDVPIYNDDMEVVK